MKEIYTKYKTAIWLWGVVALALLFRWFRYFESELLERDTLGYLQMGKLWATEGVQSAYSRSHDLYYSAPPMLPALMALGEMTGIGSLNVGLWVNLLAGASISLALYVICRLLFEDPRYALWAAILGAVHPFTLRLSALVMRDIPYVSMVLWAIVCGVLAVEKRQMRYWFLFSLFAVLASLFRKEGTELILVFCGWSCWSLWRERAHMWKELWYLCRAGVIIITVFLVCLLPVQIYLQKNTDCTWGIYNQEWMSSMYHKITVGDFAGEYKEKQQH